MHLTKGIVDLPRNEGFVVFHLDSIKQDRSQIDSDVDDEIEDKSSTLLLSYSREDVQSEYWDGILLEEAREIARYTNDNLGASVTPEQAATCCRYLLSLGRGSTEYFNWANPSCLKLLGL